MAPDRYSFSISWEIDEDLHFDDSCEPQQLLTHIEGKVRAYDSEREIDIELAAYVRAYFLDVDRAYDLGFDVYSVCDAEGDDLEGIASTFYDTEYSQLKDDIESDHLMDNSIIIEYVFVKAQFRGFGLSKLVIDSLERNFGGRASVMLLQACPQQFRKNFKNPKDNDDDPYLVFWCKKNFIKAMKYELFEQDEKKAEKKLMANWSKLGFKKYKKNFMYKVLS